MAVDFSEKVDEAAAKAMVDDGATQGADEPHGHQEQQLSGSSAYKVAPSQVQV